MMLRVSHRALFAQSLVYGYTCVVQVLEYQSTLFFFLFSFFVLVLMRHLPPAPM